MRNPPAKYPHWAKLRFWALVWGPSPVDGAFGGHVHDFYPEETGHLAELLRDGCGLLGTFDEADEAWAALRRFLDLLCERLNRLPKRQRKSRRRMRALADALVRELAVP